MTSWTAEVEWREDLGGDGDVRLMTLQAQDWGRFELDPVTGTMTAVVTLDAPDLLRALDAVLRLVRGHAGQHVTLNRIAVTGDYRHNLADSSGRAEEILAMSRRTRQSRT